MLDANFKFKVLEDEYDLILPKDRDYESSKNRVLIVMETVPTISLQEKHLLPKKSTVRNTLVNAIKHTYSMLEQYGLHNQSGKFRYACINFNAYKSFHLKSQAQSDAHNKFRDRIRQAIKKLKPTHILVCGRQAATMLGVDQVHVKTGWVHKYEGKVLATNTFDFEVLSRDIGDGPNMLGLFCRHLANLLNGEMLHKVEKTESTPYYVDTVQKFDELMKILYSSEYVAVDTETRNLSVLHNSIYTIQFATEKNDTRGYVVPLNHPLNTMPKEDVEYMSSKLKAFFSEKKGPTLITFNGMFDLRIIRGMFKLPTIRLPVWEITAGEHLLDENVSLIRRLSHREDSQGGLRNCLASYGDDFYLDAAFTKEDRSTIGTVSPSDPGFLKYAAKDVTCLLHIRNCQISRASYMSIGRHNYRNIFINHMMHMMSDTAHQLSHLRADGSMVNLQYIKNMLKPDSSFRAEIRKIEAKFRTLKTAQEANRILLKEAGVRSTSLFGTNSANWIFSLAKPAHRSTLFYGVMGLDVVSETPKGEPSTDKHFVKHYLGKYEEVNLYEEWSKTSKLLNTYIKGWYKILTSNIDAVTDSTLRPDYLFYDVVTGRLASRNPSLQVIPSRGPLSVIIKEAFEAPPGHMLVRFDYSAHEVRGWSILSGDTSLAEAFRAGQTLRKQLIAARSEKDLQRIREELATKGDIHIQNVHRFFNKWITKDDPLREAVKAIVFGTLYGKSAKTLGEDIGQGEEAAQEIINKMFAEFRNGGRWTNRMKKLAETEYYVYSPIGRRRNLWAALTGDKRIISRQVRRGSNAPIQGFCSEIGTKASRLIMNTYYDEYPKFQKALKLPKDPWDANIKFNRIVHDASYYAVPFEMVIPFMHFAQYQATYGLARTVEQQFNMKFTIEPEIEMEFAAKDSQANTSWDWTAPNLIETLHRAVEQAHKQGGTEGKSVKSVMRTILKPYLNPKMLTYLQKKYPLLGVNDPNVKLNLEEATASYFT